MKSKIDRTEFRKRLKENTKIGSIKLKIPLGIFSILSDNSKCFYGNFDDSTFELIINSNFFPTFYFLSGTYKNTEKNLSVNYSVVPIGNLRIAYLRYFPIVALIMCNSIFYFQVKPPIEIYFIFNVFILFISFFSRFILKWHIEKLKRKFNQIFEIVD